METETDQLTHLLELGHHDDVQVLHQALQVGHQQGLGAVLCEVDEGGGSVGLHPGVGLVLHGLKQGRYHLGGVNRNGQINRPMELNVFQSV